MSAPIPHSDQLHTSNINSSSSGQLIRKRIADKHAHHPMRVSGQGVQHSNGIDDSKRPLANDSDIHMSLELSNKGTTSKRQEVLSIYHYHSTAQQQQEAINDEPNVTPLSPISSSSSLSLPSSQSTDIEPEIGQVPELLEPLPGLTPSNPELVKRKRGRPRKYPLPAESTSPKPLPPSDSTAIPDQPKKRGRKPKGTVPAVKKPEIILSTRSLRLIGKRNMSTDHAETSKQELDECEDKDKDKDEGESTDMIMDGGRFAGESLVKVESKGKSKDMDNTKDTKGRRKGSREKSHVNDNGNDKDRGNDEITEKAQEMEKHRLLGKSRIRSTSRSMDESKDKNQDRDQSKDKEEARDKNERKEQDREKRKSKPIDKNDNENEKIQNVPEDLNHPLTGPFSALAHANINDILTYETFSHFSSHVQAAFIKALPSVILEQDIYFKDGALTPSFFTKCTAFSKAFCDWQKALGLGKFTNEYARQYRDIKERIETEAKWKTDQFEEYYGEKAIRENEKFMVAGSSVKISLAKMGLMRGIQVGDLLRYRRTFHVANTDKSLCSDTKGFSKLPTNLRSVTKSTSGESDKRRKSLKGKMEEVQTSILDTSTDIYEMGGNVIDVDMHLKIVEINPNGTPCVQFELKRGPTEHGETKEQYEERLAGNPIYEVDTAPQIESLCLEKDGRIPKEERKKGSDAWRDIDVIRGTFLVGSLFGIRMDLYNKSLADQIRQKGIDDEQDMSEDKSSVGQIPTLDGGIMRKRGPTATTSGPRKKRAL
ncbi:hypothetical protein BX616_009983 [Lobosporangium transversale]|uniref:Asx homology domain-domain-containing protein n=1 Tax=Lobosporangium transversale TaxID=64571 RepID=A0A1Y2GHJ1_9FUNG|nr:Asx homology domain-domain-containing protein [Lobosporangium transversale]KAF9919280.1 hypothetical protein BX616_009983 [Lobosporangium transversale]ORZ11269.1 Asx homology domain-domain-containing protein [Lobosporangium transversale]|eukprot:XP_021879584.1 Asx homology domain-domain-containing protein [Lobosporangium transversale]